MNVRGGQSRDERSRRRTRWWRTRLRRTLLTGVVTVDAACEGRNAVTDAAAADAVAVGVTARTMYIVTWVLPARRTVMASVLTL